MNKCTSRRKYAFPDPSVIVFFFMLRYVLSPLTILDTYVFSLGGAKDDWDFRISDLVKNPDGTDI